MGLNRVITAPLAVIKVRGVPIGKMRNIRVNETIRRLSVKGLGQLYADELPPVDWSGSLTCGFFSIDLRTSQIPGAINREQQTIEQWTQTLLLQEQGVQVDILKRVKSPQQDDNLFTNGIITSELVTFASVQGAFITREGFDISEGQIGGRDVEFEYLNPILYPL